MCALCELIDLTITCLSSFIVAKSALLTTEPHLQPPKTDTTVDHFTQANFRSVLNVRFSWRDHHNFTGSQYMVLHNY